MSLAVIASQAIPAIHGVPALTCHVATWYWAAKAAQAAHQSVAKTDLQIMTNIATMQPAAQPAILQMARSGMWDFSITPGTPPNGSVLLWADGGTHSAVVTAGNVISGYNQPAQFAHLVGQVGYTSASPAQLNAQCRRCYVISEAAIIAKAAQLNL